MRNEAELVTPIVRLVSFFFSFGSLLPLDAHPVTQPLPLASACPGCNTRHVQPRPGFQEPTGIAGELETVFSLAGLL